MAVTMLIRKRTEITSLAQLITRLEHIEDSELQSDLSQNVRAELKRMKRNVSAIISFISHFSAHGLPQDPELRALVTDVRRECLLINALISKTLFLQYFRATRRMYAEPASRLLNHYHGMGEAAGRMCVLISPELSPTLAKAL